MHIVDWTRRPSKIEVVLGSSAEKRKFAMKNGEICWSEKIDHAGYVTGCIEILPNIKGFAAARGAENSHQLAPSRFSHDRDSISVVAVFVRVRP